MDLKTRGRLANPPRAESKFRRQVFLRKPPPLFNGSSLDLLWGLVKADILQVFSGAPPCASSLAPPHPNNSMLICWFMLGGRGCARTELILQVRIRHSTPTLNLGEGGFKGELPESFRTSSGRSLGQPKRTCRISAVNRLSTQRKEDQEKEEEVKLRRRRRTRRRRTGRITA